MKSTVPASWKAVIHEAVSKPGQLSSAYSAFHNCSLGNQLLAMFQCSAREIPLGPISTYKGWQAKGRQVRKGEKALTLCMPVTIKNHREDTSEPEVFTYKRRWFVLAQIDGPEASESEPLPSWDREKALRALSVTEAPFSHPDGNCQGYAKGQEIAVNPVAALPQKTTFHELAHVVLGHTSEGQCSDVECHRTPKCGH